MGALPSRPLGPFERFWGWAPGPLVARPVYAPALVAFYGRPGAGVSVSIGVGSLVGWVALGGASRVCRGGGRSVSDTGRRGMAGVARGS